MQKRKVFTGKVISLKMKDTAVVEVEHSVRHPLYRKPIKRTKHFMAHVDKAELALGDIVTIAEVKPISKMKHFLVLEKASK